MKVPLKHAGLLDASLLACAWESKAPFLAHLKMLAEERSRNKPALQQVAAICQERVRRPKRSIRIRSVAA